MIRIHHPDHSDVPYTDGEPDRNQIVLKEYDKDGKPFRALFSVSFSKLQIGDWILCAMPLHRCYMRFIEISDIEIVGEQPKHQTLVAHRHQLN